MAHGKALGQYRTYRNGKVWDIVDCLGNIVCWSHDSMYEAVKHIIRIIKMEKN